MFQLNQKALIDWCLFTHSICEIVPVTKYGQTIKEIMRRSHPK